MHSLEAKIRKESAKEARLNGVVPAVVYGKDVPSTSIAVGVSEFTKLFREVGQNHVLELKVEKKTYSVLVHELQRHPVSGKPLHIDFLNVDMKAKVHIQIPIVLTGTSPAVVEGGELHQNLLALDVKCYPADIVDNFTLDITSIDHIGKVLHVSDMTLDTKKFDLLTHLEEPIVSVHIRKEQKSESSTADVSAVGVATEKKETPEA